MRSDSLLLLKQEYSAAFLCWWYTDIFLRKKNRRAEMRHNVLVYLNYFYDENIKDHDRLWRTKVVFWNFLNTIYEIFVLSEIVVFLPEKHFGKKFGQNQNFSYVIRHEVKTFLSTNTKSISIISAVIPRPMLFFFFSVLLAND